jgi:hypothetical protein
MLNTFAFTAVDFIQTGKKQIVEATVKHDKLAEVLNRFIDTQSEYTKSTIKAFSDVGAQAFGLMYNKDFGIELAESYGFEVPTFGKKAKAKAASKKAA